MPGGSANHCEISNSQRRLFASFVHSQCQTGPEKSHGRVVMWRLHPLLPFNAPTGMRRRYGTQLPNQCRTQIARFPASVRLVPQSTIQINQHFCPIHTTSLISHPQQYARRQSTNSLSFHTTNSSNRPQQRITSATTRFSLPHLSTTSASLLLQRHLSTASTKVIEPPPVNYAQLLESFLHVYHNVDDDFTTIFFPHLPSELIESGVIQPDLFQSLEGYWRHETLNQSLTMRQYALLLRGYAHIFQADPINSTESSSAQLPLTLACLRLIGEVLDIGSSTRSFPASNESKEVEIDDDSASSIELFNSEFLHELLSRCILHSIHRPSSDQDQTPDNEVSPYDELCEAILMVDVEYQKRSYGNEDLSHTPAASTILTHAWINNLVSLLTLNQHHSAVQAMIESKRIVFQIRSDPSTDYIDYIRTIQRYPASWTPSDQLKFLRELYPSYDATQAPLYGVVADLPIYILLLTSAAQSGQSTLAFGLLSMLEELLAIQHGSAQRALKAHIHDGMSRMAELQSIGVTLSPILNEDVLAHILPHAYSLALQAYGSSMIAASDTISPPTNDGLEVWLRLRRLLPSTGPTPSDLPSDPVAASPSRTVRLHRKRSKRDQEEEQEQEEQAEHQQHLIEHSQLPLPPFPTINLPDQSQLPTLVLRLLDTHGDINGMFEFTMALGRETPLFFLQQLTEVVLRHSHADHHAHSNLFQAAQQSPLTRLREILQHHRNFVQHQQERGLGHLVDPFAAAKLVVLLLETDAGLHDWVSAISHWEEFELLDVIQPTFEAMAGQRHSLQDSQQPSTLTASSQAHLESSLLLRALDILGLTALRTSDPRLLDTHFFQVFPSIPVELLISDDIQSNSTTTPLPVGSTFRHAALWSCYLNENWSLGSVLFDSDLDAVTSNDSALVPLYDPCGWLEMGMECFDQLQKQKSGDSSTNSYLSERQARIWQSERFHQLLTLHWSIQNIPSPSPSPLATLPTPPPAARLHIALHAYQDTDITAAFGLLLRTLARVVALHGVRDVQIQAAPAQVDEGLSFPLMERVQSSATPTSATSSLPALSPPVGPITLPSLQLPSFSLPSMTPDPPAIPLPFSSRSLNVLPTPGDSSSLVAHSIQSYLMEEASVAWLSESTSLSDEDARHRAIHLMRELVRTHFHLRPTPTERSIVRDAQVDAVWHLTKEQIGSLCASGSTNKSTGMNLFTLPGLLKPHQVTPQMRLNTIKLLMKDAYKQRMIPSPYQPMNHYPNLQ